MFNATSAQTPRSSGGTDSGLLGLFRSSRDEVCKAYLNEVIKRDRTSADYDAAVRGAYKLKDNLAQSSVTSGVAYALTSKLLDYYSGVSGASAGTTDIWRKIGTTSQGLVMDKVSVDVSTFPKVIITLELEDQGEVERPDSEIVNVILVIQAEMGVSGWKLTMGDGTTVLQAPSPSSEGSESGAE